MCAARWVFLVLLSAIIAGLGSPAASQSAVTSPSWAIVFQHVDQNLGDVVGLDILRSGDLHAHALTRRPPHTSDWDNGPTWSPDGRRVAFLRFNAHQGLYVVDAVGGKTRLLARGRPESIAWSPDGSRVAFSRGSGVYVAYLDGSRLKRVFPLAAVTASPDGEQTLPAISWAPNGRSLVCLCGKGIYVIAGDGSSHRRLSLAGAGQLGPAAWSPDGRLIAFEHHCFPTRMASHDFYCNVAFTNPSGTKGPIQSNHIYVWMGSIWWTAYGKLLVSGNVAGSGLGIIEIDPTANTHRMLYNDGVAETLTSAGNIVGFLTSESDNRLTLVIADRNGRTVTRRLLPAGVGEGYGDVAILLR